MRVVHAPTVQLPHLSRVRLLRRRGPGPLPGDPVPDVALRNLDGRVVRLASLWENRPAVLEFGSITCPIFVDRMEDMERLARRYSDRARFGMIYVRETHPGEGYRHIDSIEEKIEHTRDLRRAEGTERMLLVDDREGTLHRWSGGFPDSVLVVGTDGWRGTRSGTSPTGWRKCWTGSSTPAAGRVPGAERAITACRYRLSVGCAGDRRGTDGRSVLRRHPSADPEAHEKV